MIIYATKQTFERYKLKLPKDFTPPLNLMAESIIEREKGDRLLEWGAKPFYFDGRKCIQIVNFASKFTLFLIDVRMDDIEYIGNMIAHYLLDLYKSDKKMTRALMRMFDEYPITCFDKLSDRSAIATLNRTQFDFIDNGYALYDYIRDGIFHSLELNHKVNFDHLFTIKTGDKTEYIYPGKKFREIVLERYGNA